MRRVHFDLCSGEQTWRAGAKPSGFGPESYSLEINPKQPSTWTCDIREAPIREINALLGRPVLMTFSPPCTTFSIASCSTHWTAPPNRQPKTTEAIEGQEIVIAGLDLIRRFNPLYVVVENPRGLLRKMPFMQDEALGMIRKTVTYCTYQDEGRRMKPTDLWINKRLDSIWKPRPMCKNYVYNRLTGEALNPESHACGGFHRQARRGAKTGTQGLKLTARSMIPHNLSLSIFKAIMRVML